MGKTKRQEPRNGEFKKLKASKKQRNKKQRAAKANLQKELRFASEHRANRNLAQAHASMYMDKSTEADFDPSTFNLDPAMNESAEFTGAALKEGVHEQK